MSFLTLLHDHCEAGSQFIIATHSPIMMAYPNASIYVLADNGPILTPYEETEHYRIARAFLSSPQKMLDELLQDPTDTESAG